MGQLTRLLAVFMFFPMLAACEDEQISGPTADEITTAVIERFRADPYAKVGHSKMSPRPTASPKATTRSLSWCAMIWCLIAQSPISQMT